MLTELSKKDLYWREQAFNICKNKMLADEIVQDMYIYFSDKNIKVNDYYVIRKIYCIFIDFIRKEKQDVSIDDLHYLEDINNLYEPSDKDLKLLTNFEKLNRLQKELVQEYFISEKSLRQIQKEYPLINYGFAYRQLKDAKEIIINGSKK